MCAHGALASSIVSRATGGSAQRKPLERVGSRHPRNRQNLASPALKPTVRFRQQADVVRRTPGFPTAHVSVMFRSMGMYAGSTRWRADVQSAKGSRLRGRVGWRDRHGDCEHWDLSPEIAPKFFVLRKLKLMKLPPPMASANIGTIRPWACFLPLLPPNAPHPGRRPCLPPLVF